MKQVLEKAIINIDDNLFDNRYLFCIPENPIFEREVDMSELLLPYKNDKLEYRKDYKLWSEVFSPKDELAIFAEIFEDAVKNNKKIHIKNVSLAEELEMVKSLYLELGYFNEELNRFEIDFENAPVTVGVNIRNIIYSFKDYKSLREKILFNPPPREPHDQKAIRSALNSGVISMIHLNDDPEEFSFLKNLIEEEKTSLLRLARLLHFNFSKRGYSLKNKDFILELTQGTGF